MALAASLIKCYGLRLAYVPLTIDNAEIFSFNFFRFSRCVYSLSQLESVNKSVNKNYSCE